MARVPNSWMMPTQLNGCIGWFRADLGVTQFTGSVSAWADQSPAGNNLSQPVGAQNPGITFNSPLFNNQPCLTFSSASAGQCLSSSLWSTPMAQPATVIAVGTFQGNGNIQGILNMSGTTSLFQVRLTAAGTIGAGNPTVLNSTIFPGATPIVFADYVNNSQNPTNTGNTGAGTGGTQLLIGAGSGAAATDNFNGSLAEVIIFNRQLTPQEMSLIFNYLGAKYGIAAS